MHYAHQCTMAEFTVVQKLNQEKERNGLDIVSFLTFFVTFWSLPR